MKNLFLLALLFAFGWNAQAQITNQEAEMYNAMYGMQKRDVIANFVKVPEAQAAAFWEVYNQYESERQEIMKRRFELINNYAELIENLSDEKADEVAREALSLGAAENKLMSKYYAKVKKISSATVAANFVQIENYLRLVLRTQINESIPFISDQN